MSANALRFNVPHFNARLAIPMLSLLLAAVPLPALGGADSSSREQGAADRGVAGGETLLPLLEVRGKVRLVGNMPFPELVISDDEHDWYLEGADEVLLRGYEQQIVHIEGRPEYHDLILANGQKIGIRHLLRNIKIISR
jgi:hypothetical protein